jgi:uncharacterized sulfatase
MNPGKIFKEAVKYTGYWYIIGLWVLVGNMATSCHSTPSKEVKKPHILFVISDDQSYPSASVYGSKMVQTPAFDRVAREGMLFHRAFTASPGCAPSRAALLTGLNCWQLEEASNHASAFPLKFDVYPDLLEASGYFVGYTGKGWAPGNYEISGRKRNPAGNPYSEMKLTPPFTHISSIDYAANFRAFMEARPQDQPFCFWFGATEPHRAFEKGIGLKSGKQLHEAEVPPFLPDTEEIRSDLLDYAVEIAWYDKHLGDMLAYLEEIGELDNTLIVVTSDNGMAFPRAKANLYTHGFHVPLAIRWGTAIPGGRETDHLVSLIDLAPTFLEVAGLPHQHLEGVSLLPLLQGTKDFQPREAVFAARERHSSARWQNLGYPQRAVRTDQFLYIHNFKPERWPAGSPDEIGANGERIPAAYRDIDECPTLDYLVENQSHPEIGRFLELAVGLRPREELYDMVNDPACLHNLAEDPNYKEALRAHRERLGGYLVATRDPRVLGEGHIFESYPRLRGSIRNFLQPEWAKDAPQLDLTR